MLDPTSLVPLILIAIMQTRQRMRSVHQHVRKAPA
jgi:hypothetical protein